MSFIGYDPSHSFRLLSRNEGKIKSYESCRDLRAWSHDIRRRDDYLRQWIKTDMPLNVIPVSTLIYLVKKMTCGSIGKITPRCHPQCKSKVVLESICKSCHEMKECFRNEGDFDKYFEDEEFETSHWPCETCLEALKSIKMFWKIIIEKLFNIKVSKSDQFAAQTANDCTDCVRSVAKVWQTEMIQQAMFVKNVTHFLNRNYLPWTINNSPINLKLDNIDDENQNKDHLKSINTLNLKSSKGLIDNNNDNREFANAKTNTRRRKFSSKHSILKRQTVDVECECTDLNDEIDAFKASLNVLKEKSYTQEVEIEKLTKENESLKQKLHNVYKNPWWRSNVCSRSAGTFSGSYPIESLPKPYEACEDNFNVSQIKAVDSEVIITMKNCKNESYKHISLLQVLHKSNAPEVYNSNSNESNCKKEDPLVLLAKLQNKFGAIVSREMGLANRKNGGIDIDADYHKINDSKSDPSCSRTTVTNSDSSFDFKFEREIRPSEARGDNMKIDE
ncbi:unnamed protein product [Arctia plantaginis]|uniref:Uncharacterized protein n=1 Tax=Arctia plantaginis TaxID=874455 RepID=A0A8S0ZG92_ARCPL|nr:unnamed protein product [Arctia plantaginis]